MIRSEELELRDGYWHSFENTTFGGIHCRQYQADFMLWEVVLNAHPEITSICELGTWAGGFAWFLWAQAQARGLRFRTYDAVQCLPGVPEFERLDVFLDKQLVLDWIGDQPTILFCDNGNKPRELREYTQLLPEGSISVVHDWGIETFSSDIPDWLEEIHGDFCDFIGSVSRVFQRKGEE